MDRIAGFHVHRGILAVAKKRDLVTSNARAAALKPDALVVIASAVSNHDNVGALFRNAAAFEADAVFLDGECCDPLYRKSLRVSVGAVLQVPYEYGGSLEQIMDRLSANGFMIAALSPSGPKSIVELPKTGKRAVILGSEGHGLPPHILQRLSVWSIPMSSHFDSLNVATASGIALFHASRFSL